MAKNSKETLTADSADHGATVCVDRNGLMCCRVCGCTDVNACFPPCGWDSEDARGDLCTNCAEAIEGLVNWAQGARNANRAGLMRELDRAMQARSAPGKS